MPGGMRGGNREAPPYSITEDQHTLLQALRAQKGLSKIPFPAQRAISNKDKQALSLFYTVSVLQRPADSYSTTRGFQRQALVDSYREGPGTRWPFDCNRWRLRSMHCRRLRQIING